MTASETLHAAAEALRIGDPPQHQQCVADWLTVVGCELTHRTSVWERTGQDVAGLTGVLYRWPLAIARAALAEVTVS